MAVLGGIRSTGEAPGVEGFVTRRSQQGLTTITEMVEGIPGVFYVSCFRVFPCARTEVRPQTLHINYMFTQAPVQHLG